MAWGEKVFRMVVEWKRDVKVYERTPSLYTNRNSCKKVELQSIVK